MRKEIVRVMNERQVYGWRVLGSGRKGIREGNVSVRKKRQVYGWIVLGL